MTSAIDDVGRTSAAATSSPGAAPRAGSLVRSLRRVAGAVLLLGAFLADLNTGYDLSASLFYILPVTFTAWFLGRRSGLLVAALSAGAWLVAQMLGATSGARPGTLYANAAVEAVLYLATAWAVDRVNADRARERLLTAQVVEAKEILDRESKSVGRLQHALLPQHLPSVAGYAWESHYATSTRAGGDYYDVLALPDGRLGIMVADATGHGAPAAVLMAMARALLRAGPGPLHPPGDVMERLNRQLGGLLPDGWFLTACFVVLDPANGRLDYSLAGHEPPLIVRALTGSTEQVPDLGGPPLGPFQGVRFGAGSSVLEPGDTLVLYTDGLTEAMGPEHELFGVERLQQALDGSKQASLPEVKARLLAALDAHVRAAPVTDDTTILMLRRDGRRETAVRSRAAQAQRAAPEGAQTARSSRLSPGRALPPPSARRSLS
jgi:serine phosphatase RsbU (regulator of sigma subunit)